MNNSDPQFVSTSKAAKMLCVSTTLVQRLLDRQLLQGWKTQGGHRRISVQSILELKSKTTGKHFPSEAISEVKRVVVAAESIAMFKHLRENFKNSDPKFELIIKKSISFLLLELVSIAPDYIILELKSTLDQQLEVLRALSSFQVQDKSFQAIIFTNKKSLCESRDDFAQNWQFIDDGLSDSWLRGFMAGLVAGIS